MSLHRACRFGCVVAVLAVFVSTAAGAVPPQAGPQSSGAEQAAFALADSALTTELVAAEPELASPVAIAWDEDGRLYVAEMIDYPVAPAAGRIRRLCHQRQGQGHRVDPDLSGIAGRAPAALVIDVLDPNREVTPD
jgi:hypothetical protein